MEWHRRRVLGAGAGLLVGGCAGGAPLGGGARFESGATFVPLQLREDRLMRITVCTRPFRAAGPRLEAERIDGKLVVHNYGHGGSGWSLSWGCAEEAADIALSSGETSIGVVGAGAIGLTTALRLAERGADVTIYARDFPAETRSARATGIWSPSSRIGLSDVADPAFVERWERWARTSYAVHQSYVGAAGDPVAFNEQYMLRNGDRRWREDASRHFFELDDRLDDIIPSPVTLTSREHPFPVERARRVMRMIFNVSAYSDRLTRDFLLRGGRMERRDLPQTADMLALPQPVIVNCTGYGARQLLDDDSVAPVRGQINWLMPQYAARYGFFYRNVSVVSRRDGIVVQYVGPSDDYGYGDDSETPDREEMVAALATVAPLFG